MNVLKMMRPLTMMRSLQVSPQYHSQMAAVRMMSSQKELEYIKVDTTGTDGRVGLVTLNRPKALNALCAGLMDELITALNEMDNDPKIGALLSLAVKSRSLLGQISRRCSTET